jgi:hypothetical protein
MEIKGIPTLEWFQKFSENSTANVPGLSTGI